MIVSLSDANKGRFLTVTGVLILTPDALLIRVIDTDAFTLILWRGFFIASAIMALLLLTRATSAASARPLITKAELVAGMFYGIMSCFFVPALMHTGVTSALVIIAASPLISALIACFVFGEAIAARSWVASLLVVSGLAVIFKDGLQSGALIGNVFALIVAFALSGLFLTLRARPDADNRRAMVVGAMMAVAIRYADPFGLTAQQWLWMALLGGVVLPASFVLIGQGPRYIPAAEVSLLMLLESVFAPVWVYLGVGEAPSLTVVLGAVLVLSVLLWHQWPRRMS